MANVTVGPDDNIFEVLGFEKEESAELLIESRLLGCLQECIKNESKLLSDPEIFTKFDISAYELSNIRRGKITQFSINYLVRLLTVADKKITVSIT